MGLLCDYFIAADDATAIAVLDPLGPGGPGTAADGEAAGLDVVGLQGIEPAVMLGKLVAFARSVEWEPGLASGRLLWTPDKTISWPDRGGTAHSRPSRPSGRGPPNAAGVRETPMPPLDRRGRVNPSQTAVRTFGSGPRDGSAPPWRT